MRDGSPGMKLESGSNPDRVNFVFVKSRKFNIGKG